MSRYIDVSNLDSPSDENDYDELVAFADEVAKMITDAPSINIVRCKECKWLRYCETEDLDLYLDCDKPDGGGIPRNKDWFCADGERREP